MTGGVLEAWDDVDPQVPVFWSLGGTGENEARAMLKEKLGEMRDIVRFEIDLRVETRELAGGTVDVANIHPSPPVHDFGTMRRALYA